MKQALWGFLVLGLFSSHVWAAEDVEVEVSEAVPMRFLIGYDAKIRKLERYTVTFSDGSQVTKPSTPTGPSTPAASSNDGMTVKLIPAPRS